MKKGFTIIELLAAIAIMALIIIISVPAYEGISHTIKDNNLNSKLSMMEKSTLAYINKYHKDEVYPGGDTSYKICFSIDYLISKNVFSADNETDDGMTDPLNGGKLDGFFAATYNESYEVEVSYQKDKTGCKENPIYEL